MGFLCPFYVFIILCYLVLFSLSDLRFVILFNKMKKYQFRNSFIIQTTNCRKKQIDTPNTHVYHSSLSLLGTGTPITNDRVKLTFWAPNFPFTEIIQSCKCFPRVNKNINLHTCYKEHSYLEHYA